MYSWPECHSAGLREGKVVNEHSIQTELHLRGRACQAYASQVSGAEDCCNVVPGVFDNARNERDLVGALYGERDRQREREREK